MSSNSSGFIFQKAEDILNYKNTSVHDTGQPDCSNVSYQDDPSDSEYFLYPLFEDNIFASVENQTKLNPKISLDRYQTTHYFEKNQNNPSLQISNYTLSSQPPKTWLENNQFQKFELFVGTLRAPKRKVHLSDIALDFKNGFYSIFTYKKKFDKKYVKDIHNSYISKILNLDQISREEYRRIDLYFKKYAKYKDQILNLLRKHQGEISQNILKNLK